MCDDASVSEWIIGLRAGETQAAQKFWERFVDRMVRLARRKLRGVPRRVADEEDVALSVFDAALRGIQQGRFPKLEDRHDLWQILVMLTERKAVSMRRRENAAKRGRGLVRGESAVIHEGSNSSQAAGLSQVAGRECTPEFAAAAGDHLAQLLGRLPDDSLRHVALGKLAGYTNDELSVKLGCSLRAVERKLNLIRRLWESKVQL